MSYKHSCRACLGRTKEMRHVHSSVLIGGEDVRLSDILLNFYNYQLPEDLDDPENLCINCVHQLIMTHAFKTLIETSLKTFKDINVNECSEDDLDEDYIPDTDYKSDSADPIEKYEPQPIPKSYKVNIIKQTEERPKRKIKRIKRPTDIDTQCFCVDCKADFPNKRELREHCTNNHPVKSSKGRDCGYCPEKFEEYKDLVIHTKLHQKPYLCLVCWDGYYAEDDYITHKCKPRMFRKNQQSEKIMCQCDQCGKSYPSGYIKIHMATHGTEMKYSCKYCPKKFKVANGLNSHVLWNHKRTRDHKCNVCGATFISASARSTHYRKNHLKEKKYSCENCSKRFFSKSELQRHMLTHTGVKNFHCHICEKSYQTRHGLNVHLKSHAQINVNVLM